MVSRRYVLEKSFGAPLKFVYDWCTDFRDDDNRISGERAQRKIISSSAGKVAWIAKSTSNGKKTEKIRVVTLMPPSRWHVDGYGTQYDIVGDYVLKSAGRNITTLTMTFEVNYKTIEPEPGKKWETDLGQEWDRFKFALERDYSALAAVRKR